MSDGSTAQLPMFGDDIAPREPPAKGRRKTPKVDRRTDEEKARSAMHQRIVDLYMVEFKRARNVDVVLFDAADGAAVKKLIDKMSGDEAQVSALIRSAFAHRYQRHFVTIRDIASNPMRYSRGDAGDGGHLQRGHASSSVNDRPRRLEDY